MSFLTTTIGLMQTTAMRHDASAASMNASQSLMSLANGNEAMQIANMGDAAYQPSPQFGGMSPMAALAAKDRALSLQKVNADVQFAAANAWYESIQKNAQKNIESSFKTFA